MPASDQELSSLAASHDIITLGMMADEVRRARHGSRTTFVRVADLAPEPGTSREFAPGAAELRIGEPPPPIGVAAAGYVPGVGARRKCHMKEVG